MSRHPALSQTHHRPWDLPSGPWVGRQTWSDLLFMHWGVPARALRPLIPEPLQIEEYAGSAWIGIVPFQMEDAMLRGLPALAGLSHFPELNVRTYVDYEDRPGVWFFSLDATQPLAVWAARRFLGLPYYRAKMSVATAADGSVAYRSQCGEAAFAARYRPTSAVFQAQAGSLAHWLTERYCLYTTRRDGSLDRLEIHHPSWPLQEAEAEIEENTMLSRLRLDVSGAPLLHFAKRQAVISWWPRRAGEASRVSGPHR